MSQYVTVEGYVIYPSLEDLETVVEHLQDKGWMNEERQWEDELGNVRESARPEPPVDEELGALHVPFGSYRNLGYVFDRILEDAAWACLCASSLDGTDWGALYDEDGCCDRVDLGEWANGEPPEDPDERLEWLHEVELTYHDRSVMPSEAVKDRFRDHGDEAT